MAFSHILRKCRGLYIVLMESIVNSLDLLFAGYEAYEQLLQNDCMTLYVVLVCYL